MRTIILGAGQVGFYLAKYLSREGHLVSIVDQDVSLLEAIVDKIDVQTFLGFASHPKVLEQAGAAHTDLLIAVSASDEVNITACYVASSLFKIPFTIARIRHHDYWGYKDPLFSFINRVISPEKEVALSIHNSTKIVGAFETAAFGSAYTFLAMCPQEYSLAINTPFRLLPTILPSIDIAIVLLKREEDYFIPTDDDVFLPGDEAYVVIKNSQINVFMESIGYSQFAEHNVIIIGGGNIGRHLASEIEQKSPYINLKIIEKDPKQCDIAYSMLMSTRIIQGDGLEIDILKEARLSDCGVCMSLTNDDKVNILSCLMAKRFGVKRVVCLLNNMGYASMVQSLGIDLVINPKNLTVSSILKHVQKGKMDFIENIGNSPYVLFQIHLTTGHVLIGMTLENLPHYKSAYIIRSEKILDEISDDTILMENDQLIMLYKHEMISKIERILNQNISKDKKSSLFK